MVTEYHLQTLRTARYFTVGNATDPGEVWIALHGYGQLAERFLHRLAPLDDGRRLVVAPEALSRFYVDAITEHQKVGASWMTREDRLNEIEDYLHYLDAVREEVTAPIRGARTRLVLLGFSQGTATACRWAVRGRAKVDRLVLWAGLLPPDVDPAAEAVKLRALDLVLVAGERDDYAGGPKLAEQSAALEAAGVPHRVVTFPGGHEIDERALGEVMQ